MMAHVGKVYRFHFRRDLCQGIVFSNKLPEAIRCQIAGMDGAIGSKFATQIFQCVSTQKDGLYPIKWTSEYQMLSGLSFRMIFSSGLDPNNILKDCTIVIEQESAGVVLRLFPGDNLNFPELGSYVCLNARLPPHETVGVRVVNPAFAQGQWQAATWAQYNP